MNILYFSPPQNSVQAERQISVMFPEARKAIVHLWKCKDCKNNLDIAEIALLSNICNQNSVNSSIQEKLTLARTLYCLFVGEQPLTKIKMIRFIKYLNSLIYSKFISNLSIMTQDLTHTFLGSEILSKEYTFSKHKYNSSECSICLSEFKDSDIVSYVVQCCHNFHEACFDQWLKVNKTCPICRNRIKISRFDWCAARQERTSSMI